MVRSADAVHSGTISQQVTVVVTVNEVDAKVPSVTVTTSEGREDVLQGAGIRRTSRT